MGKVIMSGVSKGMTEPIPFTVPANFADATWAEIIEACERNMVPDTWVVGDQKAMNIGGTDYLIDIIGKNHDPYGPYATGDTAPLTFQMHDCYGTTYQVNGTNTNDTGWSASDMRLTHLPSILALMPSEVQAGIKEVYKMTSSGGMSTSINYGREKLFLLSEVEVYGSANYSAPGEGVQYAYYAAGNSKSKKWNTSAKYPWWLRSPCITNKISFCLTTSDPKIDESWASYEYGVAFAFCF